MKLSAFSKLVAISIALIALTGCIRSKIYSLGNGVTPPLSVSMLRPEISAQVRATKPSGTVLVAATISKTGVPQQLKVARSLDPEMDREAMVAVRSWRFKPATKDGKPVRVSVHLEVQFNVI